MSDLLGPAEVQALLADPEAMEHHSTLAGEPLLAIDLRGGAGVAYAAPALATLPCVSAALVDADASGLVSRLAGEVDVVLDSESALADLAARVAANPLASLTLVQLLRLGEGLSVADALVAESLVYSTLQTGPEFAGWCATRSAPRERPVAEQPAVRLERFGAQLALTLDRPEKRNAYCTAMRDALCEGLRLALADPSIEEVVLRGSGPDFCSGGDLDEFGTSPDPVTAHAIRTTRNAGRLLAACAGRTRAELHGACVGAGIELPAFCTHIAAHRDARFRLPEVGMGLVPGAGGTASLPRRIGRQRTARLAIGGGEIDASTALAWGLVDALLD